MKCKECAYLGRFFETETGFSAICLNYDYANFGLGIGSGLWILDWCRHNAYDEELTKKQDYVLNNSQG